MPGAGTRRSLKLGVLAGQIAVLPATSRKPYVDDIVVVSVRDGARKRFTDNWLAAIIARNSAAKSGGVRDVAASTEPVRGAPPRRPRAPGHDASNIEDVRPRQLT